MYILIDNYSYGFHALGAKPLEAIVELIEYLARRDETVPCNPQTWHTVVSTAFKENIVAGTEAELFKMVESLSAMACELTHSTNRGFEIRIIRHESDPATDIRTRIIDFMDGKQDGVSVDELKRRFGDHRDDMEELIRAMYESGIVERIDCPPTVPNQTKTAYRLRYAPAYLPGAEIR